MVETVNSTPDENPPPPDYEGAEYVEWDPNCFDDHCLRNAAEGYAEDLEQDFSHVRWDLEEGIPTPGRGINKKIERRNYDEIDAKKEAPPRSATPIMKNKFVGIMLIFNNKKYEPRKHNRLGSTADAFSAEKSWSQLGFDVSVYHDKRAGEIKDTVKKILAKPEIQNCQAFGVTLMGHGEEGKLLTFGNTELAISELITQVQECRDLKNIPKLFFIQACRGKKRMEKVARRYENRTPLRADTLVHYATYEEYVSFRSCEFKVDGKKVGSWFIYAIARVADQMEIGEKIEIHRFLTKINNEVSHFVANKVTDEDGNRINKEFCQMPEFRSTMRQDFMLSKLNEGKVTYFNMVMEYAKNMPSGLFQRIEKAISA